MAPREDLISSAVTFLRDPSVASSPVEKRIEFLRSKNLTQEEIDLALSTATGAYDPTTASSITPPPTSPGAPPPGYYNTYGQRPPVGYPYPPPGQWPTETPQPPRRDWRDYFILATVAGATSLSLYTLTKRYIYPLIAPPTPPQLAQDKASIDSEFARAFALIETLAEDTTKLKDAEEARTKRLDSAISEIESVVAELREGNRRREEDARRLEGEVRGVKEGLPRSIEAVREGSERQLKELGAELASLKTLMANRGAPATSSYGAGSARQQQQPGSSGAGAGMPSYNRTNTGGGSGSASTNPTTADSGPGSSGNPTGVNGSATVPSFSAPSQQSSAQTAAASSTSSASKPGQSTNLGYGAGKVSIPAWQLAAQKKNDAASAGAEDGADAVTALQNA